MKNILFIAIAILTLSSCKTLIPFSEDLKTDNNWNDDQIKQIQY